MTQYLIAVWDYTAEGEFELSFKQGDRIKLLEKHNEDWYIYLIVNCIMLLLTLFLFCLGGKVLLTNNIR